MITMKEEQKLKERIEKFVKGMNGRYDEHISEKCLIEMLMLGLRQSHRGDEKSYAMAILEGNKDEAYHPACKIFETVLEHGCRAGGNGHHVAQDFVRAFDGM